MTDVSAIPPNEREPASEAEPEGGSINEPPVETPLLRILTPGATDEEVAALVAVLSAMAAAGGPAEGTGRPAPAWSAPARRVRSPLRAGPGAWRASGLP